MSGLENRILSEKLLPCPFCGGKAAVVERDVEPQGDPYYGQKVERFPKCTECSAVVFDKYWHKGFYADEMLIDAWNRRRPSPSAGQPLSSAPTDTNPT